MERPASKGGIAARIGELRGMDTLDQYRFRLVALRTRIETNWPEPGGGPLRRRKGIDKDSATTITDLLVALPSPLPLAPSGEPQSIVTDADIEADLRVVAGRAVDAALALLAGGSLDAEYPGEVHMLESYGADQRDPIVVSRPSVGLLVGTIIGTLEAVSERFLPSPAVMPGGEAAARARAAAMAHEVLGAHAEDSDAASGPAAREQWVRPKRRRPVVRP
jgi:hypothetical protein